MTAASLTVEILKEIRDAVRTTNDRIDQTRIELSRQIQQTNERLDVTNDRLDGVEGALLDVAEQHRFLVRYVTGLGGREATLQGDVADLRVRVESLEAKVEGKGP